MDAISVTPYVKEGLKSQKFFGKNYLMQRKSIRWKLEFRWRIF